MFMLTMTTMLAEHVSKWSFAGLPPRRRHAKEATTSTAKSMLLAEDIHGLWKMSTIVCAFVPASVAFLSAACVLF
jgi:hypothetical protein